MTGGSKEEDGPCVKALDIAVEMYERRLREQQQLLAALMECYRYYGRRLGAAVVAGDETHEHEHIAFRRVKELVGKT